MEKKKSILSGSLIAGAVIAISSFTANASGMFNYADLGTGEQLRTNMLAKANTEKDFELKCGKGRKKSTPKTKKDTTQTKKDTTAKKGKEGKCGEAMCNG